MCVEVHSFFTAGQEHLGTDRNKGMTSTAIKHSARWFVQISSLALFF